MNKTAKIIIALLAVILLVFFYPKTIISQDRDIEICSCLGIAGESLCIGVKTKCSMLEERREQTEGTPEKRTRIDVTLLLDRSKSMEGSRLEQAKNAARDFISSMPSEDSMAIITFDKDAQLLQDFTSDQDKLTSAIDKIQAGLDTYYIPALKQAYQNYQGIQHKSIPKIIFLSDGEPSEDEDLRAIYDKVYDTTGKGICLYTIGYGDDVSPGSKAENILKSMANISRDRAGCGNYYHSSHDWNALRDIFDHSYQDLKDQDLLVHVQEPRDYM